MFFKPNEKQTPGKKYIAVWLDPDHARRLEEIAKNIEDLTVTFVDSPIMNQLSYEVLNTRLEQQGFSPEGKLSDGIAQTLKLLAGANGRS